MVLWAGWETRRALKEVVALLGLAATLTVVVAVGGFVGISMGRQQHWGRKCRMPPHLLSAVSLSATVGASMQRDGDGQADRRTDGRRTRRTTETLPGPCGMPWFHPRSNHRPLLRVGFVCKVEVLPCAFPTDHEKAVAQRAALQPSGHMTQLRAWRLPCAD